LVRDPETLASGGRSSAQAPAFAQCRGLRPVMRRLSPRAGMIGTKRLAMRWLSGP
jgi:hypothetical protein